jgi:Skp family chaperone for outer membrane proteins
MRSKATWRFLLAGTVLALAMPVVGCSGSNRAGLSAPAQPVSEEQLEELKAEQEEGRRRTEEEQEERKTEQEEDRRNSEEQAEELKEEQEEDRRESEEEVEERKSELEDLESEREAERGETFLNE